HQCFLSHYLCCASLNSQSFPTRRSSDLTEKEKDLIRKGDLEERKSRLYFTIGHVFDVSQTRATANDLPEIFPSRWLEGDVKNYDVVMESLKGIANDLNVTVGDPLGELGTAKGAFYQRVENRESIGHIGLNP